MSGDRTIAYIYSDTLVNHCNHLPTMLNRASLVQDLINSYDLLKNDNIRVVKSLDATEAELKLFHSTSYLDFLKKVNDKKNLDEYYEEQDEFGLGYDCPILENIFDFAKVIAGASLTAAKLLISSKSKIAINWYGGWHHADPNSAKGFCYINDVVIAIQKMTQTFRKILYLDLDIHHGDGVQNAFAASRNILTLSFHKYTPGFYPGSGSLDEIGSGNGKYHSINVPFLEGLSSKTYLRVFSKVFPCIFDAFKPDALVVQCGADGLNGDKIGDCNLTLTTIGECVKHVLKCDLPTMFLGGGGYNFPNAARLWTYLTSVITNREIDNDIPDSSDFFTSYAPTYELHIDEGMRKDLNSEEYICKLIETITLYSSHIKE